MSRAGDITDGAPEQTGLFLFFTSREMPETERSTSRELRTHELEQQDQGDQAIDGKPRIVSTRS